MTNVLTTAFISNKFSDRDASVHWLPHSVGCLIAYAKRSDVVDQRFNFLTPLYLPHPYAHYDELLSTTDLLCMTNYVWNQKYNDGLAARFKQLNPNGVVVYGGASVPEDKKYAELYAQERPSVDLFFVGPGEKNFRDFLLNYDNSLDTHEGSFGIGFNNVTVDKDLYAIPANEIPNPYMEGIFDDIIANAAPKSIGITFETTRGCPFKCAFCDWGGLSRSIVNRINHQRGLDTIDWIYDHGDKVVIVDIIDANLGMIENDLKLVQHFKKRQLDTGHDIKVTTNGFVKNGSPYLKDTLLTLNSISGYSKNIMMSFQTHSLETLKVIDRDNIRNEKLYPLIEDLKKEGLNIRSEMILGLPGETPESWLYTLDKDHSLGIRQMRAYPLNLIVNTPMYTDAFREKHGVESKKLLLPHDLFVSKDRYLADPNRVSECDFTDPSVYEDMEVIYACNSYSNEDLIRLLKYWWWYHNLHNNGMMTDDIARRVTEDGMSITEQVLYFFKMLDAGKLPTFKYIIDHYEEAIREIYAPEPLTEIRKSSAVNFFMKGMRTYENTYFIDNAGAIVNELTLLGYRPDSSKWTKPKGIYLDDRITDQ